MTKTEFDALKMVVPGAMPFAAGTNATVTPAGATTGDFSMPDGFGPNFDAAPTADGSNMVQRGQMNFIGQMASYAPFMGQAGRDFWGFDPDVCVALGGYPKDAILTLVRDGCYLKIISLQDDNKVDFTGSTDTTKSTYSQIVNGTVDGVNWQYLSLDPKSIIDQSIVATVPSLNAPRQNEGVIGCFKATGNGAVVANGNINFIDLVEDPEATNRGLLSVIISEGREHLTGSYSSRVGLDGWTPMTDNNINGTEIFANGDTLSSGVRMATVEDGKWYGIGFVARWCKVDESTLTFRIVN